MGQGSNDKYFNTVKVAYRFEIPYERSVASRGRSLTTGGRANRIETVLTSLRI